MAAKELKQLPFDTAPKQKTVTIGNERTGTLTFPVYGDLTVNEQAWLAANGGVKSAFSYTSKTALIIARKENVEPIEAHNFVAKILAAAIGTPIEMSPAENDWAVKYARELEECAIKVLEVTTAQQTALITCMIRHRLSDMDEWALSDTATIGSELAEEILKFAQVEQSRGKYETPEQAEEGMKEMLGKQLKESTPPKESTSTGETSSTPVESYSPETTTSPNDASDSSQVATSLNA